MLNLITYNTQKYEKRSGLFTVGDLIHLKIFCQSKFKSKIYDFSSIIFTLMGLKKDARDYTVLLIAG